MGAAVKERPTSVRDQYEKLLKAPKPVMRIDGRVQASNRLYTKHRKTLEQTAHRKPGSDKKGTDHTLPYSATHEHLRFGSKTYGAKKKAAYNERQREIRSANVGLVKRFASIISTPTEFEVAVSAFPLLENVLSYDDTRLVESACMALSRVSESLQSPHVCHHQKNCFSVFYTSHLSPSPVPFACLLHDRLARR